MAKGLIRYCVAPFRSSEIHGKLFEIKDFTQKVPTYAAFLLACLQFEKVIVQLLRHLIQQHLRQRSTEFAASNGH